MTELVRVYAHRDMDGYAHCTFGNTATSSKSAEDRTSMKSGSRQWPADIEAIEGEMFVAHGDEFWGPTPDEAERMDDADVRNGYELPVQDDVDPHVCYQVGVVELDNDGHVVHIEPLDEPKRHEFDFNVGDVFERENGGVFRIEHFDSYKDPVVTDPTAGPRSSRSGKWAIDAFLLGDDLLDGVVERASLEVV